MSFYRVKKHSLNKSAFNEWLYDIIDDYSHRFEVYYGGGGSGKSYAAVQKMILKCLGNKRKVLVVRKTRVSNKASMWELFQSVLQDMGIGYTKNISDLIITLGNGSQLLFKGMDDPEKIKSIPDLTDIVIEEATELTLDDFTQLNIRLRHRTAKYQQIFLMFNPVSKINWCYTKWFLNVSELQKEKTLIIHSTYKENKFLSEEYKQQLEDLAHTNPAYYKVYCLGEFSTLDRLVFAKYEKRLLDEKELSEKGYKPWIGLDFGYINDTTALIWGYYSKEEKTIFIVGEWGRTGLTNDKIAEGIINLGKAKEVIIADSAEKKSIDELKLQGVRRVKPCKKPRVVEDLSRILANNIIVDERCVKVIEEFENYHYVKDKNTGEYKNEVIDKYNHYIDAMRYGTQDIVKKGSWGWKK